MKKFLSLLITLCVLTIVPSVQAENEITVYVDGSMVAFDQPPVIIDDRALVPIRAIAEAMGAYVDYDSEQKTVRIYYCGIDVLMNIDDPYLDVNCAYIEIDVPPMIINDRTYIPLRALADSLQADVQYDQNSRMILITSYDGFDELYDENGLLFYRGMVADGLPNGYGTTYHENGNIMCLGSFLNGLPHGRCLSADENGNVYFIGERENGIRNGQATSFLDDGTTLYGTWTDDQLNCAEPVILTFPNQSEYSGYVNSDVKFDGQGTYTSHGAEMFGTWTDGQLNYAEPVIITFSDQSKYSGYVNSDFLPHGYGKLYNPDGTINHDGRWENGKAVVITEPTYTPTNPYENSSYQSNTTSVGLPAKDFPWRLYSGDGKVFLGMLTPSDRFDSDSIWNKYGDYGSKYSDTSIWNTYGDYGSKYSNESAFNRFASDPPIIVTDNGEIVGYLTENTMHKDGYTLAELTAFLERNFQ